jgi:hypothetical protein
MHKPFVDRPLRMTIQDVYKFSEDGEQRAFQRGRCPAEVYALAISWCFPSGKRTHVAELVLFITTPCHRAEAGEASASHAEQIYLPAGRDQSVQTSQRASEHALAHQPL